jgi:hypothetical protein
MGRGWGKGGWGEGREYAWSARRGEHSEGGTGGRGARVLGSESASHGTESRVPRESGGGEGVGGGRDIGSALAGALGGAVEGRQVGEGGWGGRERDDERGLGGKGGEREEIDGKTKVWKDLRRLLVCVWGGGVVCVCLFVCERVNTRSGQSKTSRLNPRY